MVKPKNPFIGTWRIVSMSGWDDDYLNEEVQAFIEFAANRGGSFQFGYVQGEIDYFTTNRDGKPAAEFSWEGGDGADGTPLTGRSWATLNGDELRGMFFIHQGDDSDFIAKRAGEKKRARKNDHEQTRIIGNVRSNKGRFAKEMILPGRDDLLVVPSDWPTQLAPGTLNVEIDVFPNGFDEIGEGEGLKKLDKGKFTAALVIPQRKIVGNTLKSTADEPTKGFGQVWRAELDVIDTGQSAACWMLRRIGSSIARQIELVSDEHLRSHLNLPDGTKVKVIVYEAQTDWTPPTVDEIIADWCDAASGVDEDWGSEKAMGYLIGEKFLNFLEVAESREEWRDAIPTFVAEIKNLFEPWQLADFLNTPRRLGPLGHGIDEEGHRMLRASLTEDEKVREDTRNLLLLEWAEP